MELSFAGAVLDVGVSDLGRAEAFYSVLLGRGPDLQPQPDQREWFIHRAPEVDFRITLSPRTAGSGSLSLGVADLGAERSRLLGYWPDLPAAHEKPGIITMVRIQDPDGNEVTLWQDLMPASPVTAPGCRLDRRSPGWPETSCSSVAGLGRSGVRVRQELPYLLRTAAGDGDLGGPLQRLLA